MSRIACLFISPVRGEHEAVPSCRFLENEGLLGDCAAAGGDRQLSLCDAEAIASLSGKGLCHRRFFANLLLEDFDFAALRTGDRLEAGTAVLEISAVGKRCFPECALVQVGTPCALPKNVAYARVVRSGEAHTGDPVHRATCAD